MREPVRLILGDCVDAMRDMPDNSVDVAVTSPPYNMNLRIRAGKHCSRQIVKEFSTKYERFPDNLPMSEYYEFNKTVIGELLRVCDTVFYNVQFLTGNKSALYKLIGAYHENIKEFLVWDKTVAQPAMGESVLNSRWEAILVLQKKESAISRKFENAVFKRGELQNLWPIKRGKRISAGHGAIFPMELVEKIIQNFSWEGDTILDPFMGTGTTGLACKKLNRRFIGIENDEIYFDMAKKRIEE